MLKIIYTNIEPLQDEKLYNHYMQLLPAERLEKVNKNKFKEGKLLSLGASILMLKSTGIPEKNYKKLAISYEGNGKPFLPDLPGHRFNLSHSGNHVMCIYYDFAANMNEIMPDVGCDVEKIKEYRADVAKRFFHPKEYELLNSLTDEETKRLYFYRIWTLKESYIKTTGQGMTCPLDSFCVKLSDTVSNVFLEPCATDKSIPDYYMKEYFLNNGYAFAACSTVSVFPDEMQYIRLG